MELRRSVVVFVIGGACSFDPNNALPDGGNGSSGASDASTATSCNLVPSDSNTPTARPLGALGSSNGNSYPDLECPTGELPVSVGFESTMYARPEGGNERVVVAINIGCASLALANGSLVTTNDPAPTTNTSWMPNNCNQGSDVWTPVVTASAVSCPANHVLVGAHANGGTETLFNTVTLACAPISATGAIGAEDMEIPVTDTGGYTNNPQNALCPAGQILDAYAMRGNCGIDQLQPLCSELACTP
jgi:hypothetical protein